MYYVRSPQVHWPADVFAAHPIPASSQHFLTTVGLPEYFDWPIFEFGNYDSEGADLVIGETSGEPILIEAASSTVFLDVDSPRRRFFLNSSVEFLSCFLHLVSEFQRAPDDDAAVQHAFSHMRSEMLTLDPLALAPVDDRVWAHWLAEWQSELSYSTNGHGI